MNSHHGSGKRVGKTAQQAFEILETQPGANIRPGTWWNAYNAVTYITDHELGRSDDARASSSLFGANARKNSRNISLEIIRRFGVVRVMSAGSWLFQRQLSFSEKLLKWVLITQS